MSDNLPKSYTKLIEENENIMIRCSGELHIFISKKPRAEVPLPVPCNCPIENPA